jgi:hypothetical protein
MKPKEILMAVLRPIIDKELVECAKDVGLANVDGDYVRELVVDWLQEQLEGIAEEDYRLFGLLLLGLPRDEVVKRSGRLSVEVEAVRLRMKVDYDGFITNIRRIAQGYLDLISGGSGEIVTQLRPIVRKLGRQVLMCLQNQELEGKDLVNAFRDLSKLYGQATGELVERKSVEFGASESFRAIVEEAKRLRSSGMVIEAKEWTLLE